MPDLAAALAAGPVLLDGGLSTELEARGHDVSSALWSARLLRDDPEEEGATAAESARVTKVTLGDTEGVTRDEAREESLEEIVRKAKNAPDFWSGDNPVLVGTAVSIGAAALFGQIPH